ncbi:helix-turn-helix transcriptional regulator [Sciscionella sediminilitoris]|uniref:helix-turn-helix transcriptional regulator n=1 Tax=Sciscionella sediminilitoris TaxID=1445613 RepID=UPI0004DFB3B2|nr:LuxR family transcriptional regulator [Sciscionella sp. SE31]
MASDRPGGNRAGEAPRSVAQDKVDALVARCPRPGRPAALVVLSGPAGSGKSTVVTEALARLPHAKVRRVRCTDPVTDGAMATALLGPAGTEEPIGAAARNELFAAWTEPVLAELRSGTVALVVEDGERADAVSLAWLHRLFRRVRTLPLFVVLVRDSLGAVAAPGPFAELEGGIGASSIRLAGTETLAGQRDHRAAAVWRRTADEPNATTTAERAPVPDVLRAVAVLDGDSPSMVAAVAGIGTAPLAEALRRLGERERVRLDEDGRVHPFDAEVRAQVLAGIDAAAMDRWRYRAAERLSDAGRPAAEIAAQLVRATPSRELWMVQAVRWSVEEGIRNADFLPWLDHLRWLRAASELDPANPVPAPNDVRLVQAWAHVDPAGTAAHLGGALSAFSGTYRSAVAVEIALSFAYVGRACSGLALLDEESRDAGQDAGESHAVLESARRFLRCVGGVDQALVEEHEKVELIGVTVAGRRALAMRVLLASLAGDCTPEQVAIMARRALAGGPGLAATTLYAAQALWLCGAHREAVDAVAAHAVDPCGPDEAVLGCYRAQWLLDSGDVPGALRMLRRMHTLAREAGWRIAEFAGAVLARALCVAGAVEEAAGLLGELDPAEATGAGESWWLDLARLEVHARIARARGGPADAVPILRRMERIAGAVGVRNPMAVSGWLELVLALHEDGHTEQAKEVLAGVRERVREWPTAHANALLELADGVLLGGGGRELVASTAERLAGLGLPLEAIEARIRYGNLLARTGSGREARLVLREAVRNATRAGAGALAGRAHEALRAAGGRMPAPSFDCPNVLTSSEHQVAELACRGLTNREIAKRLTVTVRTVELHLTHVYRKLGARRRAELLTAFPAVCLETRVEAEP